VIRQPSVAALVERVHGVRRFDDAVEHGDAILAADVERHRLTPTVDEALDAVVARFDAREMLIAIVFEQEVDRASIARPHRRQHVAVERSRQDAGRAAVSRDDCKMMGRVIDELGIAAGDERELTPVRPPARPRHRG
jgi:hypothetical protein